MAGQGEEDFKTVFNRSEREPLALPCTAPTNVEIKALIAEIAVEAAQLGLQPKGQRSKTNGSSPEKQILLRHHILRDNLPLDPDIATWSDVLDYRAAQATAQLAATHGLPSTTTAEELAAHFDSINLVDRDLDGAV